MPSNADIIEALARREKSTIKEALLWIFGANYFEKRDVMDAVSELRKLVQSEAAYEEIDQALIALSLRWSQFRTVVRANLVKLIEETPEAESTAPKYSRVPLEPGLAVLIVSNELRAALQRIEEFEATVPGIERNAFGIQGLTVQTASASRMCEEYRRSEIAAAAGTILSSLEAEGFL